jgi:glycosyltransferase involved in cell wall biosynthesis
MNIAGLIIEDIGANWVVWPWNYPVAPFPSVMPSGQPWPKISIVTVSYNQGQFIEATIRSVLMQGYPNLEYIVIDGGSTDNTRLILNRYQHEFSVCISEPDNGQSNAINKGFSHATGEILAWLNSDDQYLPDTLRAVALAFDRQQTDLVVGGCQRIKNHSRVRQGRIHHCILPVEKVVSLPFDKIQDFQGSWQRGEFFFQPEVFWTKQIWDAVGGGVDETLHFAMDYELWLRLSKAGAKALHINKTLATFRIHDNQKTVFSQEISRYPEYLAVASQYRDGIRPLVHKLRVTCDQHD